MSESNNFKAVAGAVLLLVGAAFILFVSSAGEAIIPGIIGSIAVIAVAVGTLILGTSDDEGRPV